MEQKNERMVKIGEKAIWRGSCGICKRGTPKDTRLTLEIIEVNAKGQPVWGSGYTACCEEHLVQLAIQLTGQVVVA